MTLSKRPLISADAIATRVAELGTAISQAYEGDPITVVAVLKGSAIFAADLIRHIRGDVTLEYVRAQSYVGATTSGDVRIPVTPDVPLENRRVLLVEDILDTGRTTTAIMERFAKDRPASVELCVLLDKRAHRAYDVKPDYVGFSITDAFVVGYGLDFNERYRHLPDIYVLES